MSRVGGYKVRLGNSEKFNRVGGEWWGCKGCSSRLGVDG